MNDAAERLGIAIDRVDNLAHVLNLPLKPELHVKCLRDGLPEVVVELKAAFVEAIGENPWKD